MVWLSQRFPRFKLPRHGALVPKYPKVASLDEASDTAQTSGSKDHMTVRILDYLDSISKAKTRGIPEIMACRTLCLWALSGFDHRVKNVWLPGAY